MLIEVVGAICFLSIGLLALASALISMSHEREQSVARSLVLAGAQALLEEIRCSARARDITQEYDKARYSVKGVQSPDKDGNVIAISVDATNPKLITVRATGTWLAAGHTESLELSTDIFSYSGQRGR